MPDFDEFYGDIERESKNGLLIKADTVAVHAAGIGAPKEVLADTLRQYEAFCGRRVHRPSQPRPAPEGSAIRGLYVCGDIASNWVGTDCSPLFSSFARADNSSMLAAEECCRSV